MNIFGNPLIGLAVPAVLVTVGAITSMTDSTRAQRQSLARDAAQTQVMNRLEAAQGEARSALAVSRYQGYCTYVPDVQLSAGMVLVGEGGQPLPDGTAVCDPFGTTATIRNGATADLASTSDQSVVRAFLGW